MPPKMVMLLDDVDEDDPLTVSASWNMGSGDGDMVHKATGTKISAEDGIEFEGQAYRLSAKDIKLDMASHLGAGACGIVKKGVITKLNVEVAIKTVRVDDKPKRDQLLHEIQGLVEAQGSPHLVQWYAGFVSKDNNSVYVALEFMDLGSLEDLLKRQKGEGVPPKLLGSIAKQSMEGMRFLHGKKLMHRDIKPGNILHNSRGEVKLTDFGIAKKMESSMAQTFVGTTIYMSPERLLGEDYSYGADVWSLGMTYYELATGKYPFADTSSFPVLFESLCEKPEPRLDAEVFPQKLCDYVAACLTRDVDKRSDALSLTRHDFVVTDVSSPQDFAAWLQKQGWGTSLYTLAEDDAENARTTMTQPTSVPSGKGAEEVTAKAAPLGLESLSMEELKKRAVEAGVPPVVLGSATREDLIAFMSG
mmetsp:Transcript_36420/g.73440  ORF Transcript_36420/g.73440 Transcript_36420/m.73440 type:complete len:418 (-) Transcript_36420:41-1294(-)